MVTTEHPQIEPRSFCDWGSLMSAYRRYLIAAARTPQTIETRLEHVRRWSRLWPTPKDMTASEWLAWTGSQDHWSRETRRSMYATARDVSRATGLPDPTAGLPPIKATPPNPRPIPDELLADAIDRANPRTRLILHLAAEAGLRRAEIATLTRDRLYPGPAGPSLSVTGKGHLTRHIPITHELAAKIRQAPRDSLYIFPSQSQLGHLTPRHIAVLACRVLPTGWTLHTLRHRYATAVYAATGDLIATQQLLGHRSPATTQRYIGLPTGRLRAAAMTAAL